MIPKKENMIIIKEGDIWNTYIDNGKYLKILKDNYYLEKGYPIEILLEHLKKPKYQMEQISKIEEIYYQFSKFYGYACEPKEGIPIHDAIEESRKKLKTFYEFALSFQKILEFTKEKHIIIKDFFIKGNVIYDRKSKTAYLIDIDSLQIPEYQDNIFHPKIIASPITRNILQTKKYYTNQMFTHDWNIFFFYELFLNTVFHKSLLELSGNNSKELESACRNLLDTIHLDPHENLYGRIMDLFNANMPNSVSIPDFYELYTTTKLNDYTKKLQKKKSWLIN